MILLAFDPGEQTGWCRIDTASGSIWGGSFESWSEVVACIYNANGSAEQIVVERFMLYPQAAKRLKWDKLVMVEVIGVIKFVAKTFFGIPVTMQNARNGKRIQLAKKPLHFDKHACDALRHALMFLKRKDLLTDELKEYIA